MLDAHLVVCTCGLLGLQSQSLGPHLNAPDISHIFASNVLKFPEDVSFSFWYKMRALDSFGNSHSLHNYTKKLEYSQMHPNHLPLLGGKLSLQENLKNQYSRKLLRITCQ